jgi:hypothetical protein
MNLKMIKIWIVSILLDSALMWILTFLISRISQSNHPFLLLTGIVLIVFIVSFLIQWKASYIDQKYLSLSFDQVLYFRYAFIIPFSVVMMVFSYLARSYLIISFMMIAIFSVFIIMNQSQHQKIDDSDFLWRHALRNAIIILVSLIASFLSLFMI